MVALGLGPDLLCNMSLAFVQRAAHTIRILVLEYSVSMSVFIFVLLCFHFDTHQVQRICVVARMAFSFTFDGQRCSERTFATVVCPKRSVYKQNRSFEPFQIFSNA